MIVLTLLLILKIFVHTQPLEPNDKDKTVNLALETVLEFNQQDNSADIQFLDHVQNFITRVRTVIDKNKMSRRDFKPGRVESLTDFLIELIAILNNYQDHDFQDVFDILDDEIRKYHYRGCKFYELTENYDIRKLMATKLDLIRGQSVAFIKTNINQLAQILKDEKYEKYSKELIDYINSLYRQDAKDKFKKVLTELEDFNKSKVKKNTADLVKVVRDGIRSVIFDHYTELNPNARRELKYKIESFWRQYKQSPLTAAKTLNESKVENVKPEVKPDLKTVRLSPNDPISDTKTVEVNKKIEPNTLEVRYTVAKEEFSKNELEREEDSNNDEDVSEHSENDSKRIELKQSDFKKPNMMRGVNKEGNKDDAMKVSEAKYTKLDDDILINEFNADATQPTSKRSRSAQRTTKKSSKVGRTFSSDEAISEDVGTVEDNSVEFNAEEMETTHQRYLTLYPEIITNEPKTADKPTVVHRSRTSELPKVITLWEEENTGGIPKYILNQMTTKSRRKSKHKKHKTTRKPKKHKKKHRKHKRKEHKSKLRSKKSRPAAIFQENNGYIDVRSTAMEFYEYKKMLGPVRNMKVPESTAKTQTLHTIQPYTKRTKPTTTSTGPLFGKRYQVLPLSSLRDFRKSALPTPLSDEGLSIEQFKIDRMPTSLRKSNMNNTNNVNVIDENVMKRIKNLEREIKDVKSKIGEAKTKELKPWKEKEKKNDMKDRKSRKTDIKTKISKPAPEDVKKNKYKLRADKEPVYKDKKAPKDKPVVDETKVSVTDYKYASVPQETRTTERTKATESIKTNGPNIEVNNNKYDVDANRIDEGKFKLVNADKHIEFDRFAPGAGAGGSGGHHGVYNYDEIDEWKGAFRPKPKAGLAKTTISSTKQTASTQTEITTKSTTVKTTEATTVPTIPTRVEIFIPLTLPVTTTTTTSNPIAEIKMDDKIDMQLSLDDINLNLKTPENLSQLVRHFAEASNMNDTKNRENIQREISFMLKKNDINVPTDKPAPMGDTRDYRDFSYSPVSFKIRKELAFSTPSLLHPNFDNNTLEAGLLLSDPFRNIDEELEFLKI